MEPRLKQPSCSEVVGSDVHDI